MSDQELKDIWMRAGDDEAIELDLPQLVVNLKEKTKKMDRNLLFRDFREIIAAIFIIIFFGYKSIVDSSTFTKITSLMFVVWAGYVIYRLLDVRKFKKAVDISQSFKGQLMQQKKYLEQQANLLDSVLSWYVGPFAVIMTIRILGASYDDHMSLWLIVVREGIMLTITYLFSWWLYRINKKAAQMAYLPLVKNIDRVLVQLDD